MSGTTARIVRPGASLTTAQTTAGGINVPALTSGNMLLDASGAEIQTGAVSASTNAFLSGAGNSSLGGSFNLGAGSSALSVLSSGLANTAIGHQAGQRITSGGFNSVIGFRAGTNITSGTYNNCFGYDAGYSAADASGCIFFGFRSGYSNVSGLESVAIGYQALYSCTVSYNVAIGSESLYSCTTGAENTALGRQSLFSSTTGQQNSAFGNQALLLNVSGSGNSALGAFSLGHNTSGNFNTGVGRAAGWYCEAGDGNTSIGYRSGYGNNSGSNGVSVGFYAGHDTLVANDNTFLGAGADYYAPPGTLVATASAGSGLAAGTYSYRVAFVLDGVETGQIDSGNSSVSTSGGNLRVSLTSIPTYTGPKTCSARNIYRTPNYAGTIADNLYYLVTSIADNTTTTYTDSTPDGSLGAAPTTKSGSVVLGSGAKAYKDGQFVAGSTTSRITEVVIGGGVDDTAPAAVTHQASNASGTNVAGGDYRLSGGRGTGSALGGKVIVAGARAGSSGSTANALVDWLVLDPRGFVSLAEVAAASVATPATGSVALFLDTDGSLKYRTSGGTLRAILFA